MAHDLAAEFPDQRGWSSSNLRYMQRFAQAWPQPGAICPQLVGKLPWGHVRLLLDRLTSQDDRDWYAGRAVDEGWSRNVLEHFIKVGLREQVGAAPSNFARVLDSPDSDLAQQLVKDPYVFDHLSMVGEITERNIERALIDRLQDTLLEFGRGMAFVGRQVRLTVADEAGAEDEFVLDLLFFCIPQRRYVIVELKTGPFEPSYAGQLGTYVAVVDDQLRDRRHGAPTIGLLLCTGKNRATVRYSLATTSAPIAVADYGGLPPDIRAVVPNPDEWVAILGSGAV